MPLRSASSFNRSQDAIGVRHPVHQGGTKSARSKPQACGSRGPLPAGRRIGVAASRLALLDVGNTGGTGIRLGLVAGRVRFSMLRPHIQW